MYDRGRDRVNTEGRDWGNTGGKDREMLRNGVRLREGLEKVVGEVG